MKNKITTVVLLALLAVGCNDQPKNAKAIMQVDYNADGEVDVVTTLTYANKNGRLKTMESDYVDPTAGDSITTYFYDRNGFEERQERANVSDGIVNYIVEKVNDDRGNVTELRYDFDADGVANQIHYFTYSADDDVLREAYDLNGDGVINRERLFTFASPGQFETRRFDDNGNGVFEYVEQVAYNTGMRRENNFLIDRNGDGTFDEEYFATWTDNPDGTVTRLLERDTDMSGSINRTDTRIMYTDDMREYFQKTLSVVRDFDNDGTPDRTETQTFNEALQILTSVQDYNADGNANFRTEYEYDDKGNVTALRYFDANGLIYSMNVEYKRWRIGQVELPNEGENT